MTMVGRGSVGGLILAALSACGTPPHVAVPHSAGVVVATLALEWSNVHVVFGRQPMIIDSGAYGDFPAIERGLVELGVRLGDVRCAVITHGHADHAGTARALQAHGIRVIAGAGDRERFAHGSHGPHHPTGWFAHLLRFALPTRYVPFTPDVEVVDRYDTARDCGVDGEVIATPGHTAGSLVVIVGGGKTAIVGDLFRGGLIHPTSPTTHFYQDDRARAHGQIRGLLARGVERFVLGHGGPIEAAAVAREFGR